MQGFDDYIIKFAERFADLRHSDNRGVEKVKSFQQISDEIFKKTGVYISHTQLSKYRNMEDGEKKLIYPKINIVMAIAKYYGVSVEYLLGLTDSRSNDTTDRHTANKFGLSDKTMALLRMIASRSARFSWGNKMIRMGNVYVSPELINFIFENDDFWDGFDMLLSSYINRKREYEGIEPNNIDSKYAETRASSKVNISEERIDSARYVLIRHFEKLIDDIWASCEFVPSSENLKRRKLYFSKLRMIEKQ